MNEKRMNYEAFLIVKKGISNIMVAEQTLQCMNLWSMVMNTYTSLECEAYAEHAIKSFKVKEIYRKQIGANASAARTILEMWRLNNNKVLTIELESDKYQSVIKTCTDIENKYNLTGAHLKCMGLGKGVTLIGPMSEDSIYYEEYKNAIFN